MHEGIRGVLDVEYGVVLGGMDRGLRVVVGGVGRVKGADVSGSRNRYCFVCFI